LKSAGRSTILTADSIFLYGRPIGDIFAPGGPLERPERRAGPAAASPARAVYRIELRAPQDLQKRGQG
jgi:hypothetical protein